MKSYEISVKFDHPVDYPKLVWTEDEEPKELDMWEEVKNYAIKHKIPFEFIEDNAVLIVEAFEGDIWDTPDFYQIDFSKLK